MSFLQKLWRSLFGVSTTTQLKQRTDIPIGKKPKPVQRKVLTIVHNPTVPSEANRRLSEVLGWNDYKALMAGYIADLKEVSHGYTNYDVVDEIVVDEFPIKEDGFAYTGDEFVNLWRSRKGFHQPDKVDYAALIRQFKMVERVNSGEIDEVWLFAFPYAGYYESHMVGPGAYWCNSPAFVGATQAQRKFVIMGFSYERGIGEMLENFGHRAESIMRHVYRHTQGEANLWQRFAQYDQTHPGQAEVGIMHFAPNSIRDYDWGNKTKVPSRCDNWLHFPDLSGEAKVVECRHWGDGDIRAHHKWWFERLPHITGEANNVAYNWWQYIVDPNLTPE